MARDPVDTQPLSIITLYDLCAEMILRPLLQMSNWRDAPCRLHPTVMVVVSWRTINYLAWALLSYNVSQLEWLLAVTSLLV